ncbi:hypothetical protein [Mammaliicoccus sciuri]|uniref:hypothetical protein n=1 Tax=Mammaliicoccus sciuri TaxID=1296 RepID=UPI002DB641C2|nr:hypothetical protein [Mammaliicoccus sciuri]MEB8265373.1 hypothetical protein [Mammaliicoccus sciuri]
MFKKTKKLFSRNKEHKNEKKMIGGILGDKSKNTYKGIRVTLVFILCIGLIVSGLILGVKSHGNMVYTLNNQTTPIGTKLTFTKSNVPLVLKEIWTDKDRKVLVAKFKYDNSARNTLSLDGRNYKITMISTSGKFQKDLEVRYGVLGTGGDGYLFLKGDLKEKAYRMVMVNKFDYEKVDDPSKSDSASSSSDLDDDEIDKALAETEVSDPDDKGSVLSKIGGKQSFKYDNIDFNLNAYGEGTKYDKKHSFLKEDGSIDYKTALERTSVDEQVNKIDKKIKNYKDNIKNAETGIEESEYRLKRNKKDKAAKTKIEEHKEKIQEFQELIKKEEYKKEKYLNREFNEKDFGDMQTELNFQKVK